MEPTFRGPSQSSSEIPDDDDDDRDGPRNVGSIQTPDAADSPRTQMNCRLCSDI